jgi:predicted amidophosphoribosyltransferase
MNKTTDDTQHSCERCDEPIDLSLRFCPDCVEEIVYNDEQANPSDGLGY